MCIDPWWALLIFLQLKTFEYRKLTALWLKVVGKWIFLLENGTARTAGAVGSARVLGAIKLGMPVSRKAGPSCFREHWGATEYDEWAFPVTGVVVFDGPVALPHHRWLHPVPEESHSLCSEYIGNSTPGKDCVHDFYRRQWMLADLRFWVDRVSKLFAKHRTAEEAKRAAHCQAVRVGRHKKKGYPGYFPKPAPFFFSKSQQLFIRQLT